jgi:hypothetical protein
MAAAAIAAARNKPRRAAVGVEEPGAASHTLGNLTFDFERGPPQMTAAGMSMLMLSPRLKFPDS